MLTARQINIFLTGLTEGFQSPIPTQGKIEVGMPERVTEGGAYGSVVLGHLFQGDIHGRLTVTLEWEDCFRLVQKITGHLEETFTQTAQRTLEELMYSSAARISEWLAQEGNRVAIFPVPTQLNSRVLLGLRRDIPILRVPVVSPLAKLDVYLAF